MWSNIKQLLELGEKMGKVSKGLKKEDMEKLNRIRIGPGMKEHKYYFNII